MDSEFLSIIDQSKSGDGRETWCDLMCFDGRITGRDSLVTDVFGSALNTGISFSISIIMRSGEPFLLRGCYLAILQCAEILHMDMDQLPEQGILSVYLRTLSTRNRFPSYSVMKFYCWEDCLTHKLHYAICQRALKNGRFSVSKEDILLQFDEKNELPSTFYNVLPIPRIEEEMAHRDALKQGLHGALMRNTNGLYVRSTLGSIYLLRNDGYKNIVTACSLKGGVKIDPLNEMVEIVCVQRLGWDFVYVDGFSEKMITEANECLVCGSDLGVRLVTGIGNARYYRQRFYKVVELLAAEFV